MLGADGPARLVSDFLTGLDPLHARDPRAAALVPHAVDLLGTALAWAAETAPPAASAAALTSERIHRCVRRHATDPQLDAAAVAAACGISRRTLYRALAADGVTFTELLRRTRVSHAQRLLLAHPKRPVAVVARECGFGGEAQLFRAFRTVTGMTPGVYRSRAGQGREAV